MTPETDHIRAALRERLGGDYVLLRPAPEGMGYAVQRANGDMLIGVVMPPRDPDATVQAIVEAIRA